MIYFQERHAEIERKKERKKISHELLETLSRDDHLSSRRRAHHSHPIDISFHVDYNEISRIIERRNWMLIFFFFPTEFQLQLWSDFSLSLRSGQVFEFMVIFFPTVCPRRGGGRQLSFDTVNRRWISRWKGGPRNPTGQHMNPFLLGWVGVQEKNNHRQKWCQRCFHHDIDFIRQLFSLSLLLLLLL